MFLVQLHGGKLQTGKMNGWKSGSMNLMQAIS
jgi:hypothetical protein